MKVHILLCNLSYSFIYSSILSSISKFINFFYVIEKKISFLWRLYNIVYNVDVELPSSGTLIYVICMSVKSGTTTIGRVFFSFFFLPFSVGVLINVTWHHHHK